MNWGFLFYSNDLYLTRIIQEEEFLKLNYHVDETEKALKIGK